MNLYKVIPKEQFDSVFNQYGCEIEPGFLGFTDIYEHLSKIIPKHFTIIDLGCAYAPQCFYFSKHKSYVGVDISHLVRFHCANSKFYEMSIQDFIAKHLQELYLPETFAICSYVPYGTEGDMRNIVGAAFKNCFTYYPSDIEAMNRLDKRMNEFVRKRMTKVIYKE
jgi:hypothetical protein